ncbi:disulfide thiol oxidoreductase [Dishui Lake large algae virus 1]|nr:disulfide thiol oxidoreductase [Dishui Lake large algae virus 1]
MASIDPKIWGSSAWILLHDISFYVAESEKNGDHYAMKDAKRFFMILRGVLPCIRCQLSYDGHLLNMPFPKDGRDLPKWVFDLHNRVNDNRNHASKQDTHTHTHRLQWSSWSVSYKADLANRRLKDIWPFIQSVVEIYPYGNKFEVSIYRHNIREFFKLLWNFLKNMEGYSKDMLLIEDHVNMNEIDNNIGSRSKLLKWVTDMGRKAHILSKKYSNCDKVCSV